MKAHEIVEGVLATVGFTTIVGGIAICTANAVAKKKNAPNENTDEASEVTEKEVPDNEEIDTSDADVEENKEEK